MKLSLLTGSSASAVGSLQERYAPLDMVIPDGFRSHPRPGAETLRRRHLAHRFRVGLQGRGDITVVPGPQVKAHRGGTYVMEGPAFSTVAESVFIVRGAWT
jgi:purine nucleoside phosphorylase